MTPTVTLPLDPTDLFTGPELRLMLTCLDHYADERNRDTMARQMEIAQTRRKLVTRIRIGK